ncbi:MAG: hypothetical protein EOP05_06525 [Proteobacteria bacterium]|nr:MAG: hypothetical protein EOP05_12525 [Pseudomonadota bacterium]RYZ75926.1 MAG: hypothetical protein EOP05_06525 [Pseudomonadota bacterium]
MAISLTKTAFLTAAMTVAPLASAFAQTVLTPGQAYVCVNASRGGLSLEIPGLTEAGDINGSLRLFKLVRTIREIPAAQISDYVNDGESISMTGLDENGKTVMTVNSLRDENGNLMVQAKIKDAGLIGFVCNVKKN